MSNKIHPELIAGELYFAWGLVVLAGQYRTESDYYSDIIPQPIARVDNIADVKSILIAILARASLE